ncbi:MAG: hypothetical protein QHJ82_14195 [Verrucomicrobiota bacterium]|nr:hypothetical protein [Verrucomicrobiota bacterium]
MATLSVLIAVLQRFAPGIRRRVALPQRAGESNGAGSAAVLGRDTLKLGAPESRILRGAWRKSVQSDEVDHCLSDLDIRLDRRHARVAQIPKVGRKIGWKQMVAEK